MNRLDGKVCLITGGASGIGRGCARKLAAEGARVVVADRDVHGGAAVAAELGAPHRFEPLDVTDEVHPRQRGEPSKTPRSSLSRPSLSILAAAPPVRASLLWATASLFLGTLQRFPASLRRRPWIWRSRLKPVPNSPLSVRLRGQELERLGRLGQGHPPVLLPVQA